MLQIIAEYYRVLQNITEYCRVFVAHLLGPIFGLVQVNPSSGSGNLGMTTFQLVLPSVPRFVATKIRCDEKLRL